MFVGVGGLAASVALASPPPQSRLLGRDWIRCMKDVLEGKEWCWSWFDSTSPTGNPARSPMFQLYSRPRNTSMAPGLLQQTWRTSISTHFVSIELTIIPGRLEKDPKTLLRALPHQNRRGARCQPTPNSTHSTDTSLNKASKCAAVSSATNTSTVASPQAPSSSPSLARNSSPSGAWVAPGLARICPNAAALCSTWVC
jgi:hypothetical protein